MDQGGSTLVALYQILFPNDSGLCISLQYNLKATAVLKSTPENSTACFARRFFSDSSLELGPEWRRNPDYRNADQTYWWDNILWAKKVDFSKIFSVQRLLTYPWRILKESSINMHFRVMFLKQILRTEIFGLCRCCMNPSSAISTGLQDSFRLYHGEPMYSRATAACPSLAKSGGGAALSSPNLYRQLEIT